MASIEMCLDTIKLGHPARRPLPRVSDRLGSGDRAYRGDVGPGNPTGRPRTGRRQEPSGAGGGALIS